MIALPSLLGLERIAQPAFRILASGDRIDLATIDGEALMQLHRPRCGGGVPLRCVSGRRSTAPIPDASG